MLGNTDGRLQHVASWQCRWVPVLGFLLLLLERRSAGTRLTAPGVLSVCVLRGIGVIVWGVTKSSP